VTWAYRLNQSDSFTSLTTTRIGERNYTALIPNVKGTEIQIQVTITADPSVGAPTITSHSCVADLGRIINETVACRRDQQSRGQNGPTDAQNLTGMQLQANILNIRNVNAGRCYAYIPDPTVVGVAGDPTNPPGVALIQARLIDYQRTTPNGMKSGYSPDVDGSYDMEADILLNLVESFDP
jgi:hypothetical protein